MHEVVPNESRNVTILQWHGSRAKIVGYSIEQKMLGILLYKMGDPELLLVVAIGSQHMVGPFSWKNSELTLSDHAEGENEADDQGACFLVDCSAGFHLKATEVTVYRIPTEEFCMTDSLPRLIRKLEESAEMV